MSVGHVYKFFGYSISYTVFYIDCHGYSVTTYLYFLIPLHLHPFSHTNLPSDNQSEQQEEKRIQKTEDNVSKALGQL